MTTRELLDPTSERALQRRERAPRPASLQGLTIGLLDISKFRGDVFLDRLQELLAARSLEVARFRKPTFAKVMPTDVAYAIGARCGAVIEALAD